MSQLRSLLIRILPKLGSEANKLRDPEARSRWMLLKRITESPRTISRACAFYGWSEDSYTKWARRLIKSPKVSSLYSKTRRPRRSPNITSPRKTKKVLSLRRQDASHGPDRIADELKRLYKIELSPSTVYAILRRKKMVSQRLAKTLTKKHLKRYRQPFPGYLQMDFKYVPYKIQGKQYYQLSCVDHHSKWRLIRAYPAKSTEYVLLFLQELYDLCPFPILEIQTDNDAAFTDKFSSRIGVTGEHPMDRWCKQHDIRHRLIPVGVKELNGKVENTHKQDDREFYAKHFLRTQQELEKNIAGYNLGWNYSRRVKSLNFNTPSETIEQAYIKATALLLYFKTERNTALYKLDNLGNAFLPIPMQKAKIKKETRKITAVEKYLKYLDWEDSKKLKALVWAPAMSPSFSFLNFVTVWKFRR